MLDLHACLRSAPRPRPRMRCESLLEVIRNRRQNGYIAR
jgi:hypothetical protein